MRTDDGRVVPNFCIQALKAEDMTVYGDGSQTRSFCYVDDLVEGILRLYQLGRSEPMNIGNPDEYTILQFAQNIKQLSKSPSQIIHRELPQDDPKRRKPDITLAKSLLEWEPKVPLSAGLSKTLDYFQTQIQTGK